MTAEAELKFVTDVLELLDMDGEYGSLDESVFKSVRDRHILFMVNANDLFYWACADAEDITPENLPMLKQAVDDVRKAYGFEREPDSKVPYANFEKWYNAGGFGASLFCARVRGMRPQRPCYKSFPAELHPLFDACGPERDPKDEG